MVVAIAMVILPLYGPVKQRLTTLGFHRDAKSIVNIHGEGVKLIPNTFQCEDAHLHKESGMIFTACQNADDGNARSGWFPPLTQFDHEKANQQGGIYVVDPKVGISSTIRLSRD